MTTTSATEYAESVARDIWANTEKGEPFGSDQERFDNGETESPELSAYDYLENALDIEYRVDSSRRYRSAKVLIGYGGPNVWIDTATRALVVAWWSAPVSVDLPQQFCDELDTAISELWEMN